MADVVSLPHRAPGRGELAAAVAVFLDHADLAPTTRRVYHASLAALVDGLGQTRPMPELTADLLDGWFRVRYATAAPATWNRELATLRSAVAWWRTHGWLDAGADPTMGLTRRRDHPDRTRTSGHPWCSEERSHLGTMRYRPPAFTWPIVILGSGGTSVPPAKVAPALEKVP